MIIFDLDGTLADCEHRRHFVDYNKWSGNQLIGVDLSDWKPDWSSFYEACDQDKPIESTIKVLQSMYGMDYYDNNEDVHIWSVRNESVRSKTEKWLLKQGIYYKNLKMRPIGNTEPDEVLKERWLNELLLNKARSGRRFGELPIDFVFDSNKKSIDMWRRRGIFVFNCCQHDDEF